MRKIFLLIIGAVIQVSAFAQQQIILFSETFESGTSNWNLNATDNGSVGDNGANRWIVNNIFAGGTWMLGGFLPVSVPSTTDQPSQITNNPQSNYLHTVCWDAHQAGISNCNYIDGPSSPFVSGNAGTNFAKMTTGINTSGITGVTLSFWWLCYGAQGSVYYSINGGSTWNLLEITAAPYQNNWSLKTLTNPAFDNQSDLRFGFMFDNNVSGGTDPGFAVDEIKVYYTSQFSVTLTSQLNTVCNGFGCNYTGPSILINEVMLAPTTNDGSIYGGGATRQGEWIELYNPDQCQSIDISCYFLGNNAPDAIDYPGGYVIPQNTIIPPQGFCVLRGSYASAVPSNLLVQNGGKTVEIIVDDVSRICIGGGTRLWFPNAGGWFAFYDRNGVPQDAISWGSTTNSCMSCTPCNPGVIGACNYSGSLTSYTNIPAARKTYIANSVPNSMGMSFSRIPDGANWSVSSPTNPTMGNCNSTCIPPPVITCTGTATATPVGGTPPITYKWNDGMLQTTATATGLCAGTYCVTITDAANNQASGCVVVQNVSFSITTTSNNSVCEGGTLTFGVSTGTGFTYNWTGPDNWSSSSAENTIPDATPSMSGTYSVTVTDNGGCTATASVPLTVYPKPSVTLTANPQTVCFGSSTTLTAEGNGTFVWGNGLPSQNPQTVNPESNTTYYITITDSHQCQNSTSVTVNVQSLPEVVASATPNPICLGQQSTISASGTVSYIWDNGLGSGDTHTVSPLETTIYTVVGTNENNCSASAQVQVIVNNPIDVSITPDNSSVCIGEQVTLTANSNALNPTYLWSNGGQTQAISVQPSQTTTYNVTVTEDTGCAGTATTTVTVNPKPNVSFTGNPLNGCEPLTVQFNETSGENNITIWAWTFGDGTGSTEKNPSHIYSESGMYDVQLVLTNSFGCKDSIKLANYIEVYPQPIADFYTVPEIGKTYSPTLTFYSNSEGQIWSWSYGDGNSDNSAPPVSHTYPELEQSYDVTMIVSNQHGCADTITKTIQIINDILLFPNVITPNGDGVNDKLEITNSHNFPGNKLVVFNRWGKEVFEQTDYKNDWDGGELSEGTYYYIFYYSDKFYQASLTIIR